MSEPHYFTFPSLYIDSEGKGNYLFDPSLLKVTLKNYAAENEKLQETIYDGKFRIRPLSISDYYHGYIDLLRQLTECGTITYNEFKHRLLQMKECPNTYYIVVIEDIKSNREVIASATLVCEKKFIRQLSVRGRIEDVVVNNRYRGQHLGKLLIELLNNFARDKCHCYKVSLECKDELVSFYKQFGFDHEAKQNYLCQRFAQNKIQQ